MLEFESCSTKLGIIGSLLRSETSRAFKVGHVTWYDLNSSHDPQFRIIAELGIKYQDEYIIEVFKEYGLYNKMSIFAENQFHNRYQTRNTRNTGSKTGCIGRQYNVAGPRDFILLDFSSSSKNSGANGGICNRNSNISNNSEIIREYDELKSSDVDCIKEVFNLRRFNIIVNRKEIIVPIHRIGSSPDRTGPWITENRTVDHWKEINLRLKSKIFCWIIQKYGTFSNARYILIYC